MLEGASSKNYIWLKICFTIEQVPPFQLPARGKHTANDGNAASLHAERRGGTRQNITAEPEHMESTAKSLLSLPLSLE